MAVGNAIIGALRVVLGADTVAFDKGFKDAETRLSSFQINFAKSAAAAGAAIAAVGATVALAVRGALDEAEKLGQLSAKLNAPVEDLSKLKFVADQVGASFEEMAEKFKSAIDDNAGMGGRTLTALGISPDAARSLTETIALVADRFATLKDGAGKTALAVNLFGQDAEKMLPILDQGSARIRDLSQRAEDLGYVFDERTAAAGKRLNAALKELTGSTDHMGGQIIRRLPVIVQLAEAFASLTKNAQTGKQEWTFFTAAMEGVIYVIKGVGVAVTVVAAQVANLLTQLQKGSLALGKFMLFDFSGAKQALEDSGDTVAEQNRIMWESVNKIWGEGWNKLSDKTKDAAGSIKTQTAPVVEALDAVKESGKAALMELIAAPWEDFATKMAAVKQALADGVITPVEEVRMRMRLLTEEWRLQKEEARAALDTITSDAWTSAADKMQALEDAVRRGTVSFREFGQVSKQIGEDNRRNWDNLASTAAQALTVIFDKSKTAAIAAAIINTAQGITKALAQGGILGIAQAALIAAMGIKQIATIRSTSMGSSGSISASAPAAPSSAAPMGQAQQLFVVESKSRLFTRDQLRELFDQMNDAMRNGARLVVTT